MICSCGASNPDDAEFCTFCYARLKPKDPPRPPAEPPREPALLAGVEAAAAGWAYHGFLLARAEGLHLFVSEDGPAIGLLRRALVLGLGQIGGMIGNVVVDAAAEAGESRRARPAWPVLKHRQEFAEATHACASAEVLACDVAFFIPAADVVSLRVDQDGAELQARQGPVVLRGSGDWDNLRAAATAAAWPLLPGRPRRRAAAWAALVVAAAAAVFALSDVREVAKLNERAARRDGVSGIVLSHDGARYIMPDGSERKAKDVPWSERLPLYRWGLLLAGVAGIGWLFVQARQLRSGGP